LILYNAPTLIYKTNKINAKNFTSPFIVSIKRKIILCLGPKAFLPSHWIKIFSFIYQSVLLTSTIMNNCNIHKKYKSTFTDKVPFGALSFNRAISKNILIYLWILHLLFCSDGDTGWTDLIFNQRKKLVYSFRDSSCPRKR